MLDVGLIQVNTADGEASYSLLLLAPAALRCHSLLRVQSALPAMVHIRTSRAGGIFSRAHSWRCGDILSQVADTVVRM
jgi:hypothetical protein